MDGHQAQEFEDSLHLYHSRLYFLYIAGLKMPPLDVSGMYIICFYIVLLSFLVMVKVNLYTFI